MKKLILKTKLLVSAEDKQKLTNEIMSSPVVLLDGRIDCYEVIEFDEMTIEGKESEK